MHSIRRFFRIQYAAVAILLLLSSSNSRAQEFSPTYYGVGGAANLNQHSLSSPVYRGSELCGTFTEGSGIRPSFHFLFETKPSGWPVWLSPRLIYNNLGADLTTPATDAGRVRDPIDSTLIASSREHRMAASIPSLGLDLFAKYKFGEVVYAFGGPSASFLLSPSAPQEEVITAPSTAFFDETGTNTRITNENKLEDASAFHAAFGLGLGVDIPIAHNWSISPELSAHLPITKILSADDWTVTQFRFGVTLKMDNAPPLTPPPPPLALGKIGGSVQLLGLERNADGTLREFETPIIRIEEFVSREAFPVLNSVFFDPNSATIPSRYSSAGSLDTNTFRGKNALQAYHQLLDIVGSRLRSNTQAKITIRGIQTSEEAANDPKLAEKRAQAVSAFLAQTWGIDPSRVTVASEIRTASTDLLLREEQQKVDIVSSDPAVFDPFIVQDITRTMNPPGLRVRSSLSSTDPIRTSSVSIKQQGGFNVDLGTQQSQQDWFASNDQAFPSTERPLVATVNASSASDSFTKSDSTQVQQLTIRKKRAERIADLEVERYNLITFEFDKATLDDRAERIMKMIAKEATSRDNIEIAGYTDLIGDPAYNSRLATDRARSVESALRAELSTAAPGATIASRGEGEVDLYNNSLPEGRQLSRTVRITIKRPIGDQ